MKGTMLWRKWLKVVSVFMLGVTVNVNAADTVIWKEEVLLHDGQKIIVKRSQSYGGRREPGQSPPIKEHTITFTLPGSSKTISWTSEYGEDLGRTNFNLLAVHVLNGTPYIVASPNLCLSYNKWGRPNPPYVFFKHDGKQWQRIPPEELPPEFKTANVVFSIRGRQGEELISMGFVSADKLKELNSKVNQPEYKTILREALPKERCPQYPSGPKAPIPITPSTLPK